MPRAAVGLELLADLRSLIREGRTGSAVGRYLETFEDIPKHPWVKNELLDSARATPWHAYQRQGLENRSTAILMGRGANSQTVPSWSTLDPQDTTPVGDLFGEVLGAPPAYIQLGASAARDPGAALDTVQTLAHEIDHAKRLARQNFMGFGRGQRKGLPAREYRVITRSQEELLADDASWRAVRGLGLEQNELRDALFSPHYNFPAFEANALYGRRIAATKRGLRGLGFDDDVFQDLARTHLKKQQPRVDWNDRILEEVLEGFRKLDKQTPRGGRYWDEM